MMKLHSVRQSFAPLLSPEGLDWHQQTEHGNYTDATQDVAAVFVRFST